MDDTAIIKLGEGREIQVFSHNDKAWMTSIWEGRENEVVTQYLSLDQVVELIGALQKAKEALEQGR